MAKSRSDLFSRVQSAINNLEWPMWEDASVRGVLADIAVELPNHGIVLVEVRELRPTEALIRRMELFASQLREATGVYGTLVVIGVEPNHARNAEANSNQEESARHTSKRSRVVLGLSQMLEALQALGTEPATADLSLTQPHVEKAERIVFVSFPMKPAFDNMYWDACVPAAEAVNAGAYRADKDLHTQDIVQRIHSRIDSSVAVIADLTESNPNVLYEVGYARRAEKPVLQVSQDEGEETLKLPFMVRNAKTHKYDPNSIRDLRLALIPWIRQVAKP